MSQIKHETLPRLSALLAAWCGVVVLSLSVMPFPAHAQTPVKKAQSHAGVDMAGAGEAEAEVYTLPESIRRGLRKNPGIKAAGHEVGRAKAQVGARRSDFLPSFSTQVYGQEINSLYAKGPTDQDYIDQKIGVLDLRLSQTLFDGFTIFNRYERAKLEKELAEAQKEQAKMELILEIQKSFLKLLKAREDVRSLEEAVERLEVNKKSAAAYYKKDMAPYTQVLQASVDLADTRQELSQAKNSVRVQKVQLNELLAFPADKNVDYQGDLTRQDFYFDKNLQACLTCAYDKRPEISIREMSLEIAGKDQEIAKGQFSPKLSLNFDYYTRDTDYDSKAQSMTGEPYDRDQKNEYFTAALRLEWQFGLGGREYYNYQAAEQEAAKLRQQLIETRDRIDTQVRTSYLSLEEARSRIESTRTGVDSAQEAYARAKRRFDVKMGTIAELLDAQARLTRAEANYNQAVADYQLSLAHLYYAMGEKNYVLN